MRTGHWLPRSAAAVCIAPALLSGSLAEGQVLEQVIVTAQKREQSSQDVPITITTLSGEALQESNVKDLFQAADFVPGMVFSRAPDDGLGLTFRGLGTPARSQAFEQSVAVFLDGVFLAKGRLYSMAFFDVERLELIKGTQSTLLGKNTSLGAISVVSRAPGKDFAADVRAGVEIENGGYTFDGGVDIPLGSTLAMRIAGHYNDSDGWVRNSATGRDVPNDEDLGVRATLRFEPSADFEGQLSYQHSDSERLGSSYQIVDPALPPQFGEGALDDRQANFSALTQSGESEHDTTADVANLRLTWSLGEHSLVSQSAYVDYELAFDDDFDFSNASWIDFFRDESYSQFSEEIRLASPTGGTLEYLVGLFYFDSEWDSLEQQLWAVAGFPPGTPIAGQLFNGPFTNDFTQDTTALSGFGQLTWHVSERWRLTAGLRYTDEDKDVVYGRTNAAPFTLWNTVANPPFPRTPLSFSDSFLDGNANAQFDVSDNVMAYVAYGRGTKTGGYVESNTVASANPAVDAFIKTERTRTVELGMKTTLRDDSVWLNVAVFDTEIKDFQDTTFTGSAFITENLPVEARGIELDATWQVSSDLKLATAWTYSDAEAHPTALDRSLGVTCDPCRPAQSPKWNGTADVSYVHPLGANLKWRANLHARYRSEMFNQRGEAFRAGSFLPVDVSLGIESAAGTWGMSVLGRNIFDRVTADFSSPSGAPYFAGVAGPAPFRTVTLMGWLRL